MAEGIIKPSFQVLDDETISLLASNSRSICDYVQQIINDTHNLSCILPLLFRYNGKPVTLEQHFHLETLFYCNRPRQAVLKCARQVGKSFQQAVLLILRAMMIPSWNLLYIAPLFEHVRRFSSLYIRGLIQESPVRRLLQRKGFAAQVLQRTFGNNSTLFFNYAQRDANRTRGTNTNENFYDEIQLITRDTIDILRQTMGGSPYGEYEFFSGTPLSPNNLLEQLFNQSTSSEWMIKCRSCGFNNIASVEYDLIKMIGPVHDDIGPDCPGLVCARCSKSDPKGIKPIFPQDGRWFHRNPENRDSFLGLHLPQPIMPWHANSRSRWVQLNNRISGGDEAAVFNEILGEPANVGFKPISELDLKRAAVLGHNGHSLEEAFNISRRYPLLAMGIDWGGGGIQNFSRTKAAIVGLDTTGKTDVIYGVDLNFAHRPFEEIRCLMLIAQKFGVHLIAHDAGGAVGAVRESLMLQTGKLNCVLWAMMYVGAMKRDLIREHVSEEGTYYSLDKARSLSFLCQAIKQGHVRFFDYDYINVDNPGLLYDFTALTSEVSHRLQGSDILIVDREEGCSDDFAHAVNFGACALWSKFGRWPRLSTWTDFHSTNELSNLSDDFHYSDYSTEEIEAVLQSVSHSICGPARSL